MSRTQHRGPHPDDARLFSPDTLPRLQRAAEEVAWLLDRGYSMATALTAVGNHHQLELRQRIALSRGCCSEAAWLARTARALAPEQLVGRELHIDGFNLIIALEVALGGGPLVQGRDGCLRDLAGLRGSYHLVAETETALAHVGRALATLGVAGARFYLDAAVSNSGRLRGVILEQATAWPLSVTAELLPNVDPTLATLAGVVSADAVILDACQSWTNLAAWIVARHIPEARLLHLFPTH
ncbi:MAG TPA: DUF434 domain-containing protein [Polyangia bacterium]|jgi:hypothetical protein|nr:DUF434 domain-containing protein [Polyangia bacterium]